MSIIVLVFSILSACSISSSEEQNDASLAEIQGVNVSGKVSNYHFSVTVKSPDTGCDQYANWWEVLSENGELIYRRILAHSHVDEQPFTRSGGPVKIKDSDVVIVRMHMNNSGYSSLAMKGSAKGGFEKIILEEGFASEVELQAPQPDGCRF
ncbi:MAG: hypothetical protein AAF363_02145 [Bacteroidota bacterium]